MKPSYPFRLRVNPVFDPADIFRTIKGNFIMLFGYVKSTMIALGDT